MAAISPSHKALAAYYAELEQYRAQGVTHELALKTAFQSLLATLAHERKWTLVPELTLDNGKRPDGALLDGNGYTRGYWEAKDPGDDLETEISRKIAAKYPLRNTIFEDTRRAVLYQAGKRYDAFDLTQPAQLANLLSCFFDYTEAEVVEFEKAVEAFKEQVPSLAAGLRERIKQEHAATNPAFTQAWASFFQMCRASIDPQIRSEQVDDMLVQHLLTERLFRTVFDNDEFTSRNVIAAEIEKVITALTSRAFNRREFLKSLDHFYRSIEDAAKGLEDWSAKQRFLNIVYERFF